MSFLSDLLNGTPSEYDHTKQIMANSFPWLFPGGMGDIWDRERGSIPINQWGRHLLRYSDGRFASDQLFTLYMYNTIIRHKNNEEGHYFYNSGHFLKGDPPTLESLKNQIQQGESNFVSILQYYSANIRGSDSYWRGKAVELQAWINHHLSLGHGPPTFFITLSCAENWWPDLVRIMTDLEKNAGNLNDAFALEQGDLKTLRKSVKRYPVYVNEYFLERSRTLMDTVLKDALGIKYYWGRVEFAPGRGQIHLHILSISNDHAYLKEYHKATTKEGKAAAVSNYMEDKFSYTANTFIANENKSHPDADKSPLRFRYSDVKDEDQENDKADLAEDCMTHVCNDYCLQFKTKTSKLRECNKGFGKEKQPGKCDTEGFPLINTSVLRVDGKSITHLDMKRTHSRRVVQHSELLLQIWRANIDVKCLIFDTDPNWPNLSEIEAIVSYICAYTVKKNKTVRQEKEMIQDLIIR